MNPQLFFKPPSTLSNYALGVTNTIYITILDRFRPSKSLTPSYFTQFKHCFLIMIEPSAWRMQPNDLIQSAISLYLLSLDRYHDPPVIACFL